MCMFFGYEPPFASFPFFNNNNNNNNALDEVRKVRLVSLSSLLFKIQNLILYVKRFDSKFYYTLTHHKRFYPQLRQRILI